MTAVIKTEGLTVCFGDFTAVDSLNLSVEAGQIFGFLGPNGSGKSTTVRVLCGILQPTRGECFILGHNVSTERQFIRQEIGYMSQKFSLYQDLTAQENLDFYAGLYGIDKTLREERIQNMLELAGLEKQQDVLTGSLAGGMRQRLALSCAVIHQPRILFLDEPTSGVDPKGRRLFWQIIYRLADAGTTVLITTHFMDEAEHCDCVGFINEGRLTACGSPQQLKESLTGVLVNISGQDSMKLLGSLQESKIPLIDAYISGTDVRLLLARENLSRLGKLDYEIITPSMEDVFVYYARQQRKMKDAQTDSYTEKRIYPDAP